MRLKHASVQGNRLGIEAIKDDVIELSGGEYRAVLEVSGLARPFDDELRLEGLMAGFAAFLNGLSYPVQILVRASPVDLSPYVASLEERGRHMREGQLVELAHDHATFVERLAKKRTLLERRFFVVVPAESPTPVSWIRRLTRIGPTLDNEPHREAAQHQLSFRCEDVRRQLGRCGLAVRRMKDVELAHLYLTCWAPQRARVQRFRQHLDDYVTLAVRAEQAVRPVE